MEELSLQKEKERNFLAYFERHETNGALTENARRSCKYALRYLRAFIEATPLYSKYDIILPMDVVTPEFVSAFTYYLRKKCIGEGPRKHYHWFKRVIANAIEEGLMKKNPCKDIKIVYDTNVMLKEILTPDEILHLAQFRYEGEQREIQRAFIFCCYTGMRYCDVKALTYANIDYSSMVMRFNQKKAEGRSAHAAVAIPLNEQLLNIIGQPDNDNLKQSIFKLPHTGTARKHLMRWVKEAGIRKHITWHCGRHSFAVNLLNAGANIKTVSSLLGHANIKMTEKYLHVVDSLKQQAIDSLGPISFDMGNAAATESVSVAV